MSPKIYPVIHYLDRATAFNEVGKAMEGGADGCFLISHLGNDTELLEVAAALQQKHPSFTIGVNLLSTSAVNAANHAKDLALPLVWADDAGVDSRGLHEPGQQIMAVRGDDPSFSQFELFASVAFKYRPPEPNPALAAKNALRAGFIPTTSGTGTGSAPSLEKIKAMSLATGGVLAVASGMTPWNVHEYAPHLSHILVATGIALDEHRLDVDKLRLLIANSRSH